MIIHICLIVLITSIVALIIDSFIIAFYDSTYDKHSWYYNKCTKPWNYLGAILIAICTIITGVIMYYYFLGGWADDTPAGKGEYVKYANGKVVTESEEAFHLVGILSVFTAGGYFLIFIGLITLFEKLITQIKRLKNK